MHVECAEQTNAETHGTLHSIPLPADRSALYLRVINSVEWKRLRAEILIQSGRKCALCGAQDRPLELHHNTYDHLGEERDHPQDVTPLCCDCHGEYHEQRRAA